MLIKLEPTQISGYWDVIKPAILGCLPPYALAKPEQQTRLLEALLSGKLVAWAGIAIPEGKKPVLHTLITTAIEIDAISGTKNLLIYSVFGYEFNEKEFWLACFKVLAEYAKLQGCDRITGFSSVDRILDLAKSFGAKTEYTFVTLDVKDVQL